MKALKSKIARSLPLEARVIPCDNSGAKELKIFTVMGLKNTRRRVPAAAVGDLIMATVKKGRPDMRKKVVLAVIVRQKKEYRRPDGTRIAFEDNAAVVLKDEKGNPKGTIFKGPIAKEVAERWPAVAKVATMIV
ncbi:50S ribosomal protein L14 [Candidatus Woesearchaeota archaeon]|nr:50S ribosomal protein L14 [Candidatus Woesearchaeota archaeon]